MLSLSPDRLSWAAPGPMIVSGSVPLTRNAVLVSLNLLPFAAIAFLWFVGVVRDRIGAEEDRFFATVFLGSGLLFVAMLLTGGAVAAGLVATAADTGVAGEVWPLGRRVTSILINVYAMRMAAVFTIATTTIVTRLRLVSRWLGMLGYATAAVLLIGVGFIPLFELLFPAWVFILSIHILIVTFRHRVKVAAATAAEPSFNQPG